VRSFIARSILAEPAGQVLVGAAGQLGLYAALAVWLERDGEDGFGVAQKLVAGVADVVPRVAGHPDLGEGPAQAVPPARQDGGDHERAGLDDHRAVEGCVRGVEFPGERVGVGGDGEEHAAGVLQQLAGV